MPATPGHTGASCAATPTPTPPCPLPRSPAGRANDVAQIHDAASGQWTRCLALGATHGWRNAQASLIAPTGTIGIVMDCDTLGVEPDFALVKTRKVVGGGSQRVVNSSVARALAGLGYDERQAAEILSYIGAHAISKTVNLPASATVEDIELVYRTGWRLGLKAIAVYRDGCKATQPVTAGTGSSGPSSWPGPARRRE